MASHPLMGRIIGKFDRQEDCDVIFNVQGRRLGAHKMILSLQDFPLFDKSKDQGNIQVDDVEYKTFRSIIRFLYTDEISIDGANIFLLMHASHCLQIAAIEDRCSSFFPEFVTNQNFVHLLNISTDFKNTVLQKQLLKFFKGPNMTTIIHDVNFKRLTPEGIALLLTVPPSGDNGAPELDFFIALRRWARFECQKQGITLASGHQIRQVFGENFKYLGVPYMRLEDVARLVIGKGILEKDEELSLLHFMSMPAELRKNIDVQFPFDYQMYKSDASSRIINCPNCAFEKELPGLIHPAIIRCSECGTDFCGTCQRYSCNCYGHEVTYCSSCGTKMMVDNVGRDKCGCENELPIPLSRSENHGNVLEDDKTRSFKIENKKCALCCNKLDCKYGAEMIHCTECQNDFCFKCQSKPNHQSHRKFFSVKTVLGDHTACCKTCGWPKEIDAQGAYYIEERHYESERKGNSRYHNPQNYNPQYHHQQYPQYNNTQYHSPFHNPQYHNPQYHNPQYHSPQYNNPQYHNPSTSYTCLNCECTLNE